MSPILAKLVEVAAKPERIVVGAISGTSADAISVAVCRMRGPGISDQGPSRTTAELIVCHDHPYSPDVRAQVLRAGELKTREVAELHVRVGALFAEACLAGIRGAGLAVSDVDLVGSHGQTIYHHSSVPGAIRATFQVGDGDQIAERTGVIVISDFRSRDIAAGGEGAPLTPLADMVLFAPHVEEDQRRRVILNLGGIANITVLDWDPSRVFGFDTGPANALIDRLARRLTGGNLDHDRDGLLALSGKVNQRLLEELLAEDTFLARRPPKSTGFEMYGDAFLEQAARRHGGLDCDLMATLTEFTARSVAQAIQGFVGGAETIADVIVAGGGANNPALAERLAAALSPIPLRKSDELGVPIGAREAMGFAVLANESLLGRATVLPAATGASRAVVSGKLSFPIV